MSYKCYFQYHDGTFCKLWPMHGSRFCQNHQPPDAQASSGAPISTGLAPIPIRNPRDVLRLLADTLNGLRTGAVSPGRGYATACVAKLWFDQYRRLKAEAYGKGIGRKVAQALGVPYDGDAPFDPSPDPAPDPPAAAAPLPPTPPPHDPWAAGRMAGPVPVEASPPAPISIEQAEAKLREAMGWKPDSPNEPLSASACPQDRLLHYNQPRNPPGGTTHEKVADRLRSTTGAEHSCRGPAG